MNILIADDSRVVASRLTALLTAHPDWTVVGRARDGKEAVRAHRSLAPDVTILDIRMPKMSGIAALEEIMRSDPSAKVVILTNFPEPQYRRRCLDAGASAFLDKSSDFQRLPEVVEGLAGVGSGPRPSGDGVEPR